MNVVAWTIGSTGEVHPFEYLRESGSDRIGALDYSDSPVWEQRGGTEATLDQLHARLLRASFDIGNPINGKSFELSVRFDNPDELVQKRMKERGATWLDHGDLNAHLEQQ